MKRIRQVLAAIGLAALSIGIVNSAGADDRKRSEVVTAKLVGVQEIPALSTAGRGWFRAVVDERAGTIHYRLAYDNLAAVQQSHLHFGQHHTAGGISVFLCTNLGNSPGAQACPTTGGQIDGVITPESVIGPGNQGIAPGEFAELVAAIRSGAVYVNVHTAQYPAGEIRGQLF